MVDSEKPLPAFINTDAKLKRFARSLAEEDLGVDTKSASFPRIQGMYSTTIFVKLKNNDEIVIQLRHEPLDVEPFLRARSVLGDIVPEIKLIKHQELEEHGFWPVYMARLPGRILLELQDDREPALRVKTMSSLGQILASGIIQNSTSEQYVQSKIIPRLQKVISSDLSEIKQSLTRRISFFEMYISWTTCRYVSRITI